MKRLVGVAVAAFLSVPVFAYAQSLSGLRIEGPDTVPEESITLYGVVAEFDNGWEFDVTLDSFLWVEPGIHADIGVFGEFEAAAVDEDVVETIYAFYVFGAEIAEASLVVTIVDVPKFPLVIERIRPCGNFVLTPLAPFP
jgi:hypothetical protein